MPVGRRVRQSRPAQRLGAEVQMIFPADSRPEASKKSAEDGVRFFRADAQLEMFNVRQKLAVVLHLPGFCVAVKDLFE
jgi:hypothetical protein